MKRVILVLGILVLVLVLSAGALVWYLNPACERIDGIVYGQRGDRELTLDVVQPDDPNGLGVILMVSGSWKSDPEAFRIWMAAPLLRAGYTVLAVSHVSQPRTKVQDIVTDMHRAVRFIRYHAKDYGIDPERLGVTGGSSGGHLSLMLATGGKLGPPDAPDPIDRESSAVQAAAVFFPVTNLANLGSSTENAGDGGPPRNYRNSFGPEAADLEKWRKIAREISPVFHVRPDLPPILIVHGDADKLVPLEQSVWFVEAAKEVGAEVELRVREDKKHGWMTMIWDVREFALWFDRHLKSS